MTPTNLRRSRGPRAGAHRALKIFLYKYQMTIDVLQQVKRLRATPQYDSLCEAKERTFPFMTSTQFLVMAILHDLVDHKVPIKDYIASVPKDCHHILRGIVRDRMSRVVMRVAWSAVEEALQVASPYDADYEEHLFQYAPMRRVLV